MGVSLEQTVHQQSGPQRKRQEQQGDHGADCPRFLANLKGRSPRQVEGGTIEISGERFYRVVNYDAMAPFLMSLVSDSDHWMFVSSTGALTTGLKDPDHALFPYYTDDHSTQPGPNRRQDHSSENRAGRTSMAEPFSKRYKACTASREAGEERSQEQNRVRGGQPRYGGLLSCAG